MDRVMAAETATAAFLRFSLHMPNRNSKGKKLGALKSIAIKFLIAMGLTICVAQVDLDYFESYLYDLRIRSNPNRAQSGPIELVYLTPKTIQQFSGYPTARKQIEVLQNLLNARAKAIVYDFDLLQTSGDEVDKMAWAKLIANSDNVFVAYRGTPLKGEEEQLHLPKPFEKVVLSPAPKTTDLANFAKDGVSRRLMMTYQNQILLPVHLASLVRPEAKDFKSIRGHFEFYGTDQAYIDFLPAKRYSAINFESLIYEPNLVSRYHDKIIFIGTDLGMDEAEYTKTPFSREVAAMTRIELLANTVDTLIRNSGPLKPPRFLGWLSVFFSSLLSIYVVLKMKPIQGLISLGSALFGFVAFSFVSFWLWGWWIPTAGPLLTIFLCYYFIIPYRLIKENQRGWEYYQKNKLLSQVEELKTNFISMMSHDLKTPIARIQGMTDIILTDQVQLSSQQREAVDTIKHSSQDLLKFINAILAYGKIESQGIQLRLQSKDINSILNDVVRKHEFHAKVKQIQILIDQEPLFPVPVDSDLMTQVFSNLVENAIKYSPNNTQIFISSAEKGSRVVVQVGDQGPGIPEDDLQNIFMKFFRSKNVKSSPIKGSGLGLYLAKYFTELHEGKLFVDSTYGKGSVFTVELPITQGGPGA